MVDGGDQKLDRDALDTLVRRRGYDEKILAVLFRARERLLLAVGLAIAELREAGDPLRTLQARIHELLAASPYSSRRTATSGADSRGLGPADAAITPPPNASKSWSS